MEIQAESNRVVAMAVTATMMKMVAEGASEKAERELCKTMVTAATATMMNAEFKVLHLIRLHLFLLKHTTAVPGLR